MTPQERLDRAVKKMTLGEAVRQLETCLDLFREIRHGDIPPRPADIDPKIYGVFVELYKSSIKAPFSGI